MEFSEREIDRLYSAMENSERLRVVACNGMGYPCELEGYIAIVKKDEMPALEDEEDEYLAGIFENAIILDCGKMSQMSQKSHRTPHSLMLFTNPKDLDLPPQPLMYIKSIRSLDKSDVIYCNYEFDYLQEFFEMSEKAIEKDKIKHGTIPASKDKDGKFLNDNIGKPMKFGNQDGILTLALEVVPNGDILVFGMTGPNLFTTYLQKDKNCVIKNGVVCDIPRVRESASPVPEM